MIEQDLHVLDVAAVPTAGQFAAKPELNMPCVILAITTEHSAVGVKRALLEPWGTAARSAGMPPLHALDMAVTSDAGDGPAAAPRQPSAV